MSSDIPTPLEFVQAPPAPDSLNVLLYGPSGAGKSTAAATAPGDILWVNAEGPNALAFARKTAAERGTRVHEVRIESDADPRPTLRAVITHIRSGNAPACQTVVVDTLGKLREALIRHIVVPGAKNSLQQFGEVSRVLGEFVRVLRDQQINVVLIAHESVEDADGERIVRPLIGGQQTELIPSEMDVVAYCAVVRGDDNAIQYLGQLVEGRGRRAKDRSGGLGITRPLDLTDWFDTYRAALTPDESDLPFSDAFDVDGGEA